MTNDQRQKIAEHLRAIGNVLTDIGHGEYEVRVLSIDTRTVDSPTRPGVYTLQLIAHTREVIQ